MGDRTAIEWTDVTWNPVQGCTKVSAACKHCYMFRDKLRYGQDPSTVVRSSPQTFRRPLAKHGARSTKGTPGAYKWPDGTLVFTCSWSDWFHKDADEHRPAMWDVVRQRPGLIFQILTKRADRIADHLPPDWGDGWPNVWLGVTVEHQEAANERIPHLLAVPAAVRFVSCEPLLGPVDLLFDDVEIFAEGGSDVPGGYLHAPDCPGYCDWGCGTTRIEGRISWVITGGESGPKARPSHPQWFRDIRDQCEAAGVAYLHKQNGEHAPMDPPGVGGRWLNGHGDDLGPWLPDDGQWYLKPSTVMHRPGKKRAGRQLDGRTWDEFP